MTLSAIFQLYHKLTSSGATVGALARVNTDDLAHSVRRFAGLIRGVLDLDVAVEQVPLGATQRALVQLLAG
jgi:hypothetical protein